MRECLQMADVSLAVLVFVLFRLFFVVLKLEDILPDQIGTSETLFGDGLGLDSIDAVELGAAIRKAY